MSKSKHETRDVSGYANLSQNPSFHEIASRHLAHPLSRRMMLRAGAGGAVGSMLGFLGCSDEDVGGFRTIEGPAAMGADAGGIIGDSGVVEPVLTLGFSAVPKSIADTLTVPPGYTATVLYRTGDPIDAATSDYPNNGTSTDFDRRAGDQHDGMEFMPLSDDGTKRDVNGVERGVLGLNHENIVGWALHSAGITATLPRPQAEVDREILAHGLSFIEVQKTAGRFAVNRGSSYNRRITSATAIELAGPASGNGLLRTKYSTTGVATRGTVNNCGTGITPWGTLLSGEENWVSYVFRAVGDDAARGGATNKSVVALARYGSVEGTSAFSPRWDSGGTADVYARWNGSVVDTDANADYRNVLNTFGYILEVDPYTPSAPLRKRTALGRFAHEGASFQEPREGKPIVVYMGDDSRSEYIYKFVSTALWSAADANATDRIAVGNKYLDSGKLYVAKFAADGTGTWLELSLDNPLVRNYAGYPFADIGDVLINARIAADAAGATKMDRPEWCSVNPKTNDVYFTLTNNSRRTPASTDAPNPRSYTDQKGMADGGSTAQSGNVNGHILRFAETGGEPGALTFRWDVYLFGAEALADEATINLSGLDDDNDFSSPDGLWFSPYTGVCWIQTDDGGYTDVTNCMMLAALPGSVGDGADATITYGLTDSDGGDAGQKSVTTKRGAKPTPATLKRFLVGPMDCELTGVTETPDGRAMFVNIQHPGETTKNEDVGTPAKYTSHWPDGGSARPRSATVVITKNDGGKIGS